MTGQGQLRTYLQALQDGVKAKYGSVSGGDERTRAECDFSQLHPPICMLALDALKTAAAGDKSTPFQSSKLGQDTLALIHEVDTLQKGPDDGCLATIDKGRVCRAKLDGKVPLQGKLSRCKLHLNSPWYARVVSEVGSGSYEPVVHEICRVCEREPTDEEDGYACMLCACYVHVPCLERLCGESRIPLEGVTNMCMLCAECAVTHWTVVNILREACDTVTPSVVLLPPTAESEGIWVETHYQRLLAAPAVDVPKWLVRQLPPKRPRGRVVTMSGLSPAAKRAAAKGKGAAVPLPTTGPLTAPEVAATSGGGALSLKELRDSLLQKIDEESDDAATEGYARTEADDKSGLARNLAREIDDTSSPQTTQAALAHLLSSSNFGAGKLGSQESPLRRQKRLQGIITGAKYAAKDGEVGSLTNPTAPIDEPVLGMSSVKTCQRMVQWHVGGTRVDTVRKNAYSPEDTSLNKALEIDHETNTITSASGKFGVPVRDVVLRWWHGRSDEVYEALRSGLACFDPSHDAFPEVAPNALLIYGRHRVLIAMTQHLVSEMAEPWPVVWRYICAHVQYCFVGGPEDTEDNEALVRIAAIESGTARDRRFKEAAIKHINERLFQGALADAAGTGEPSSSGQQSKGTKGCPLCEKPGCDYRFGSYLHTGPITKPCRKRLADGEVCGKLHATAGPLASKCRVALKSNKDKAPEGKDA